MKIHAFGSWKAIGATPLVLVLMVLRAPADPVPKPPEPEKNYTGIVTCVDTNEQVLRIKRSLLSARQFAYGDNCAITLLYAELKNEAGTSGGLRPGEKVTVSYQDSHGVKIPDRIEQQPMQLSGTVTAINPANHTLTLRRWLLDRRLNIAADCITMLGNDRVGALTDIYPGDQVVVVYETPDCRPTAWQITKTPAASPAH
jgi:hypothetical protein